MRFSLIAIALWTTAAIFSPLSPAHAQTNSTDGFARDVMSRSTADFLSGSGNLVFLAAGTLYPLTQHGINDIRGQNRSLRVIDTALTATAITEGLKLVVRSQRPDGTTHDSFPSGHATAAFAVATIEARYDKGAAPFWYAGAALIAISRVRLNRHRWEDVVTGAAIGIGTGEIELQQRRGLLLSPIIGGTLTRDETGGPRTGLALSLTF